MIDIINLEEEDLYEQLRFLGELNGRTPIYIESLDEYDCYHAVSTEPFTTEEAQEVLREHKREYGVVEDDDEDED